jgi:hypothetical protein
MPSLIPHAPHIVATCAIHAVGITLFRSPTRTNPNVVGALLILVARLIGLLRSALWLNRHRWGLVRRRVLLSLGEYGTKARGAEQYGGKDNGAHERFLRLTDARKRSGLGLVA